MVHVVAIAANVGRLPPAEGTRVGIRLRVASRLRKPGLMKVNWVSQGNKYNGATSQPEPHAGRSHL